MSTAAERAEEVVALWKERKDRGEALAPEDLVGAHPDIADEIRLRIAALDLLDRALREAAPSTAPVLDHPDFRILREIGRGGMGVVYEAEQVSMRRIVAVKVLYPSITLHPKAVERFRREAQAAGRLHHTNIVPVYGMGEAKGAWFYAMERIHGRTLADVIADLRRLGASPGSERPSAGAGTTAFTTGGTDRRFYARVAEAFAGLAEALEYAHSQGVLHRDVKPANVMLDQDGTLKLTDFGLARTEGDLAPLTVTGDLIGTPAYMSPEQVRPGKAPLDGRTDVYSLGATLYEVLTRHPPYEGRTYQEVFSHLLTLDPEPVRRRAARVPKDLETIVSRAMERDRNRRYASAADLAGDLRRFAMGQGIQARRLGLGTRIWRWGRRHPVGALLATAAPLLVTAGVLLLASWQDAQERRRDEDYDRLLATYADRPSPSPPAAITTAEWMADVLRPADGEAILDQAIRLRPDRTEAYVDRALGGARLDERLKALETAAALGLPEKQVRLVHALVRMDSFGDEDARRAADAALALPDDGRPMTAVFDAFLLHRLGRVPDALKRATEALQRCEVERDRLKPGARVRGGHAMLRLRAELREAVGDLTGAIEDLARVQSEADRLYPGTQLQLARLWALHGDPARSASARASALEATRARGTADAWRLLCIVAGEWADRAWSQAILQEARAAHPSDPSLLLLAVRHEAARGAWPEALRLVDRVTEVRPTSIPALWWKAQVLCNLSRHQDALGVVRRAREISPDDSNVKILSAQVDLRSGNVEEGLRRLTALTAERPSQHAAWCATGHELLLLQRWEEALGPLRRGVETSGTCESCRDGLYRALVMCGRSSDAREEVDAALRALPWSARLHRVRSLLLLESGELEEALVASGRAAELDPDDLTILQGHAEMLAQAGRIVETIPFFERLLALLPADPTTRERRGVVTFNLANALVHAGRGAAALSLIDGDLTRFPEQEARRSWLKGSCLLLLGRPAEVLGWLDRAVLLDASFAKGTLEHRYHALRLLGRTDEASRCLEAVPGIAPRNRALMRARLLADSGQGPAAARVARDVLANDLGSAFFRGECARILRRVGQQAEARAVAEGMLAVEPASAKRAVWMAYLAALRGRKDHARRLLGQQGEDRFVAESGEYLYVQACVHCLLGDQEAALRLLGAAVEAGYREPPAAPREPEWELLAGDVRYETLRARLGTR